MVHHPDYTFPLVSLFGVVGHHPLWWHFSTLEKKCWKVLQLVDFIGAIKTNRGCLVYIGNYTTQLCGDFNKPFEGSLVNNQYIMENIVFVCFFCFFRGSSDAWEASINSIEIFKDRLGQTDRTVFRAEEIRSFLTKDRCHGLTCRKALKRTVFFLRISNFG